MSDHVRTWTAEEFRLDLWDTGRTRDGKSVLHYALFDGTQPYGKGIVFEGEDFCASPMHAIDSDATVAALLSFLSLQTGDTDAEYFDTYTPAQLAWRDRRAEGLSLYAYLLEQGDDAK